MANYTGNSGEVQISDTAIAEVLDFSVTESAVIVDNTVLGDTWRTNESGTKSFTGSINCYYMEGDTTGQDLLTVGSEVTIALIPRGDTAGNKKYTGTVKIETVSKSVSLDGIITAAFTFTGNGALTASTIV